MKKYDEKKKKKDEDPPLEIPEDITEGVPKDELVKDEPIKVNTKYHNKTETTEFISAGIE